MKSITIKDKPKRTFLRQCKHCKNFFNASSRGCRVCLSCYAENLFNRIKNQKELYN